MIMKSIILKAVVILCVVSVMTGTAYAGPGLEKLFSDRNVKGTIIISSLDGKTQYLFNEKRSKTRFLPASTFKIPNTLIALDEGVIADEKEVIKWDGKDRGWPAWNKDQSLETAFPVSCVWFYQELARRVGNDRYLFHFKRLDYGNSQTGPDVTTFWLNGDLKISAEEQIAFLKRLYNEELPYKRHHIQLLKKIMIVEETPDYTVRAKTGWAMRISHQHGWYIGYVETKGQVWFFATNIDIHKKSDALYRKEITMAALKLKGII